MKQTMLIIINGFLGSGKTTLMLAAADALRQKGSSVACITNDQGSQLIDTKMVFKKQLPLQQIEGGCFCCKFDQLVDAVNELISNSGPDVIIAEAVGSCTDLVATVIEPLIRFHGDKLDVQPLTVVVDPNRLAELISDSTSFSEDVVYVYRKQLEEAQCILLNKIDQLSEEQIRSLLDGLSNEFKYKEVLTISALYKTGIQEWVEAIITMQSTRSAPLEIDYDRYAQGEAELGWLNASVCFEGLLFDVEPICRMLFDTALQRLQTNGAEVAHMKLWAQDEHHEIKISSVSNSESYSIDHSPSSKWVTSRLTLWINARVHLNPSELDQILRNGLDQLLGQYKLKMTIERWECFAPGRPVPTYRLA